PTLDTNQYNFSGQDDLSTSKIISAPIQNPVDLLVPSPAVQQGTLITAETAVSATQEQFLRFPALDCLGLVFNIKIGCIICLSCHFAIRPELIKAHIYNQHPVLKSVFVQDHIILALDQCPGLLKQLPILGPLTIPYVQGLSLFDGLQCGHCHVVRINQDSLKRHYTSDHPQLPFAFTSVQAQRLNNSDCRNYFSVSVPTQVLTKDPNQMISALRDIYSKMLSVPSSTTDSRLLSPWLHSTHWHDLLLTAPASALVQYASFPKDDEIPGLAEAVHHLFSTGYPLFNQAPELVLQRLVSPDPVKS
ncbi:hypothetical protein H0H93_012440, partial [Arthromyces matolae]